MTIPSQTREAFEKIYACHTWGGNSRSGPGSDPAATKEYVSFVNKYLARHPEYRSIVEFGCGDWATTQMIDMGSERDYTGYDIVKDVIDANSDKHQSQNIRFYCSDFLSDETKVGDLLLIKDVLQHLSNKAIQHFLELQLPRFRAALITNDVDKYYVQSICGFPYRTHRVQTPNTDIVDGASRPLRLDEYPFSLKIHQRYKYKNSLRIDQSQLVFIKEILAWVNPERVSSL